jgi:tRNA A-37 threonylcarbamoyl transferase component Bud32
MDVGERYVLGRLIGEGATARVYAAEDSVLRREVAVKLFRDADIGDDAAVRIGEEARILASLAHPHLLPVFDFGRDAEGHRFIVMPLVRGTTLAQRLVDGPLGPPEVKRIGKALADALSHIHARGILHRDVKPSNVLLALDGTPYLADFGFAYAEDGPALTATGCIVGTAGYLAPEQAEGLPLTPAVDVYALGLVLLEALTAERAYRGTPLERATANALRPPRVPARLGPGWARVLRTMTARAPTARPVAAAVSALIDVGEDVFPEVTASGDTMELPVGVWSGLRSGPPVAAFTAVPVGVAQAAPAGPAVLDAPTRATARLRAHRRQAALGAAAFAAAAVAVVGIGADWLASGAAADTRVPSLTTPGAGAAGRRQAPAAAPVAVVDPGNAAVPPSRAHRAGDKGVPVASGSASASSASAECRVGNGQNGNGNGSGHGRHGCPAVDGDTDH